MTPYDNPKDTEECRPGDTTNRLVVGSAGSLFAVLGVSAAVYGEIGVALFLAVPALVLFVIALRGKRKSVEVAKNASSVIHDISYLP